MTNRILRNLPNRIRSREPRILGFRALLSGIEKRFATHQEIDGRGIGKQGEFADAKQNSSGEKAGSRALFSNIPRDDLQTASLANECGGSSAHDRLNGPKAFNSTNEKAQKCENVADKGTRTISSASFCENVATPGSYPSVVTKRGKLTSQRGASPRSEYEWDACATTARQRRLSSSAGRTPPRLCLACDKQVRQLPAPIPAKPGLTTGRFGEIPVDAPNRGARSRSTRRCERPLDATRSILTDGAIRVGAKRAFFRIVARRPTRFGVSASRRNRRLPFEVFLTRSRYPPSSQVHTANQVARRHVRSWLCDACQNGSAKVRRRPRR